MRKKFHIGIDIGKHGAIVIMDRDSPAVMEPMPLINDQLDYLKLYNLLSPYEGGNGMIVFEKLGVIFKSTKATAFSMGHQAGAIEMLCVALAIPYTKVNAKDWQKEMFVGIPEMKKTSSLVKSGEIRDTKGMALMAIQRLHPRLKLTFGKATKPHDGLVDAVLMAEYSRRKFD